MTDASAPQTVPPETPQATPEPASSRSSPFRRALEGVSAYQAGMSLETARRRFSRDDFVKLASNENLFGPSPRVYEAIAAARHLELYPDPYCEALRADIAERLGVDAARVIMGAGSETLIDILMRALLEPGDEVLISSPTFPLYSLAAGAIGARLIDVPRTRDFDLDVQAVCGTLAERRPKLIILCTPNNPTGNAISPQELERLFAAAGRETFILFDEAYFEFNEDPRALDLLQRWGGDWLLLRTFSKAYGLASCRVGYGVASQPQIVGYLDRIRPAFNVTGLSQLAARAAWGDTAHLEATVATTVAERERMHAALAERQIRHTASRANFVFVESRVPVAHAAERLLARGVIVRPVAVGEHGWLRITVGRPDDNDRVLAELGAAIGG